MFGGLHLMGPSDLFIKVMNVDSYLYHMVVPGAEEATIEYLYNQIYGLSLFFTLVFATGTNDN